MGGARVRDSNFPLPSFFVGGRNVKFANTDAAARQVASSPNPHPRKATGEKGAKVYLSTQQAAAVRESKGEDGEGGKGNREEEGVAVLEVWAMDAWRDGLPSESTSRRAPQMDDSEGGRRRRWIPRDCATTS